MTDFNWSAKDNSEMLLFVLLVIYKPNQLQEEKSVFKLIFFSTTVDK